MDGDIHHRGPRSFRARGFYLPVFLVWAALRLLHCLAGSVLSPRITA